ncbi:tagatose-6-phosphate kinase [Striga asiatica]|uniref:Tagatose-6-phosphate kinase n=1 Tax=Striga asiatica TaxID=4170 RepID=A0A5A7QTA1_STRAF|nr:tagatose-6-phosphate kinase [Striga asiatica]
MEAIGGSSGGYGLERRSWAAEVGSGRAGDGLLGSSEVSSATKGLSGGGGGFFVLLFGTCVRSMFSLELRMRGHFGHSIGYLGDGISQEVLKKGPRDVAY